MMDVQTFIAAIALVTLIVLLIENYNDKDK